MEDRELNYRVNRLVDERETQKALNLIMNQRKVDIITATKLMSDMRKQKV